MFPPSQVVPQIIVAHTAWSNLIPSMSWKVTFKMPGNCQRSLYYQTQQFLNNENFKKLPFWLFDLPKDSKSDSTIYFFCCVCVCVFNRVPLHLPNSQWFFLTASLVKNTCDATRSGEFDAFLLGNLSPRKIKHSHEWFWKNASINGWLPTLVFKPIMFIDNSYRTG